MSGMSASKVSQNSYSVTILVIQMNQKITSVSQFCFAQVAPKDSDSDLLISLLNSVCRTAN